MFMKIRKNIEEFQRSGTEIKNEYLKLKRIFMKQVKNVVGYWCEDTITKKYLGQGVGVAVLDTGISLHPDFDTRITFSGYNIWKK